MGLGVNGITPSGSNLTYEVGTFNASDTVVVSCGTSTALAVVTVQCMDADGHAIACPGFTVELSTTGTGTFANPATPTVFAASCDVTTNSSGLATAILRSSTTPSSTLNAEVINAAIMYNTFSYD